MPDRPANAAPVNVSALPPLLTIAEAAAVWHCSDQTVRRRLADPNEPIWPTRLGRGRRAPVRVARDAALRYAGLLPSEDTVRRKRRANAEYNTLAVRLGITSEDEQGNGGRQ